MRTILMAEDYEPRSQVVTPEHIPQRAKFTAIDAHNHVPDHPLKTGMDLAKMVHEMDLLNLHAIVNLTGGTGDTLKRTLAKTELAYPGRFITFCNVDWIGVGEPGWIDKATRQLEEDIRAGARGLKIFKRLGLEIHDTTGNLVLPNDPRIADLWDKAGELDVPVLIHSGDPPAFFRPLDRFSERWTELHDHPEWLFYGPKYPSFQELIDALYQTIEDHPKTTFITAHAGCYAENLGYVSKMLDAHPNMITDFSARIAELGRAPYSARKWFIKYADRIIFGTDEPPTIAMYRTYFRFLETADEYFDYDPENAHPQGEWKIYGLHLPDDVLHKIYYENPARLLKLT
jgi:predicted TIM-barrel fold metal-dependent hydrolase